MLALGLETHPSSTVRTAHPYLHSTKHPAASQVTCFLNSEFWATTDAQAHGASSVPGQPLAVPRSACAACLYSEPFLKGSLRASLKNVVNISTEINWMSNFNNVSHPSSSLWEKGCWKKSRRGPVCQSLAVFLPVIANSLIKYFLLPWMPLFT